MIVYFNGHKRLANPEFSGNYPAIFADETKSFYAGQADEVTRNLRLRSYILTVGALQGPIKASKTSFDSILPKEWYRAYDSNACGNTKARCLFVPISHHAGGEPHLFQGIPVLSIVKNDRGLDEAGLNPNQRGSDYAASVVTASITLLVQYFKETNPQYNGLDAAQDLLDTTFGLRKCRGMRGKACRLAGKLDHEVGHGLLDLKAALSIQQTQDSPGGVALTSGDWAAVPRVHRHGSLLALGTPFGDAPGRLQVALDRAIVIDDLGRAHRGALSALVATGAETHTDLLLLAPVQALRFSVAKAVLSDKAAMHFSFSPNTTPFKPQEAELFASGAPSESLSNLLGESPSFSVAYRSTEGKGTSQVQLSYSSSTLTGRDSAEDTNPQGDSQNSKQQLIRLAGKHSAKPEVQLRWQAALLDEESQTLGGANQGIYGFNHGAQTYAFSLGASRSLPHSLTLNADITASRTHAGQGGLIARWNKVRALGWALGLTQASHNGKTLTGAQISQPLRTTSGTLDLHYPARYYSNENRVAFESARVGLRPSGRELRLEIAQSRTIKPWLTMQSRFLYRHQPNHTRSAPAEYGFALGFNITF